MQKKRRLKAATLVSLALLGATVVACKATTSSTDLKNVNERARQVDFNDVLANDYDAWTAEQKIAKILELDAASPKHEMKRRGIPRRGVRFIADSLDFRTRPVESVASLGVFSRLRDVYPKSIKFLGFDVKPRRLTHPTGSIAKISLVPDPNSPKKYTGIFSEKSIGIARMSTATDPSVTGVMNRALAIKFPISGSYSRTMFAMNRVVGQNLGKDQKPEIGFENGTLVLAGEKTDFNYFKKSHNFTNFLARPKGFEKGVTDKFFDVVKYILRGLGRTEDVQKIDRMSRNMSVANLSWHTQDGRLAANPKAPYRIVLKPRPEIFTNVAAYNSPKTEFADFRDDLATIPVGTTLWDVYATDNTSDSDTEQTNEMIASGDYVKIASIVLESKPRASKFGNETLMYKHFVSELHTREDLDRQFLEGGYATIEKDPRYAQEEEARFQAATVPQSAAERKCAEVGASTIGNMRLFLIGDKVEKDYRIVRSERAPYCFPKINNTTPGFPNALQGVWWMNGNPLPDVLVTFANADYDANTKELTVPVYAANNWSWYASDANYSSELNDAEIKYNRRMGLILHRMVKNFKVNYRIRFDINDQVSDIVPQIFKVKLANENLVNFDFILPEEIDESMVPDTAESSLQNTGIELIRRSSVLGRDIGDYNFVQVVDSAGNPTDAYAEYLEAVKSWGLKYQAIAR